MKESDTLSPAAVSAVLPPESLSPQGGGSSGETGPRVLRDREAPGLRTRPDGLMVSAWEAEVRGVHLQAGEGPGLVGHL